MCAQAGPGRGCCECQERRSTRPLAPLLLPAGRVRTSRLLLVTRNHATAAQLERRPGPARIGSGSLAGSEAESKGRDGFSHLRLTSPARDLLSPGY